MRVCEKHQAAFVLFNNRCPLCDAESELKEAKEKIAELGEEICSLNNTNQI